MKALITGATSGIGLDIAKYLSLKNIDLILVGRNKKNLEIISKRLKTSTKTIVADLSNEQKVKELYTLIKKEKIDILVNNAGFGDYSYITDSRLDKDLDMINTNIKAVHILTKLVLKDMEKKDSGYILNVASSAAFAPGPLMSTYYASKSYVYRFSEAIYYEEKVKKKNVHISVLCPGPVDTNFNNIANVNFSMKAMDSKYVAKYAIDMMFKNKLIIIPGFKMKFFKFGSRFLPEKLILRIIYNNQTKKKY